MKTIKVILTYQANIINELKSHTACTLSELHDNLCVISYENAQNFTHALRDLLSTGRVCRGDNAMFTLQD